MSQDDQKLVIAFLITGGLGDHVNAARFVRDLEQAAGPFAFDIYTARPAVARWLFDTFSSCRACYDEATAWDANRSNYPLGLWVAQFVSIDRDHYDPARLNRDNAALASVAETIRIEEARYDLFVANSPRTDALLARKAHFMEVTRSRISHAIAALQYGGDLIEVGPPTGLLERLELADRRYVTVHTGYDLDFSFLPKGTPKPSTDRSTRAYGGFDQVVALLKAEFRDLVAVQVGGNTSRPIAGADINLINRTTLAETADVLRGALLHLDSDGGLVDLATALGTKCAVIFGPTAVAYMSYKNNINLPPPVCGECWWTTDDWQTDCPRGMHRPRCLSERTPESVLDAVRPALTAAIAATSGRRGLRARFGLLKSGTSR